MSYYHHLFELYVDRTTRICNIKDCDNTESLKRVNAATAIWVRVVKGNTLVSVTVKNLTKPYWCK